MGGKKLGIKTKTFGQIPVVGEGIPEDCGYQQKFKYNIDMNTNGIPGECIDWCEKHCKHRWGWWFEQTDLYSTAWHNWEDQKAYMSFSSKREAMKFWLAIGLKNMGDRS